VVDALLNRFSAAEHHRSGRSHSKLMRCTVHVHPFLRRAFQSADPMPDAIVEDLGATPWD
jgi:hypothetical protein